MKKPDIVNADCLVIFLLLFVFVQICKQMDLCRDLCIAFLQKILSGLRSFWSGEIRGIQVFMNLFSRKQTKKEVKKTIPKRGKIAGRAAVLKQRAQPKKLPEELIGYISGKDLLERGYLFFEAERWYSIDKPEN
ncbi:MAG: hypothetical protein IKU21_01730, partial [Anaerotignum sp.]|nr:hypothetical protein [Anaerotignum sp.]